MVIVPLVGSIILNSARLRLDFPAPVRPTIPTFEFLSSRFFHNLSIIIYQHKCLHLLVIGDIQVEVLKHAGQLWPVLGGVPIKLDLSYVTRLCISSYIRLSNVKIIKYQV